MRTLKKILLVLDSILLLALIFVVPVLAWFSFSKEIAYYSPLSSPESIYIGAGHVELRGLDHKTEDKFEDIRYLYFEGIDLTDGKVAPNNYSDHVICVFGRGVQRYMIQLAFTTNNGFEYELYSATETTDDSDPEIVISHETHELTPRMFYYKINERINGNYLNKNGDVLLAKDDDKYYDYTFDTESGAYENVHENVIPLYWRTASPITGNTLGGFIHYYILRVVESDKLVNDKETDIICISARAQ